jgi:cardiolipin synthase A/B
MKVRSRHNYTSGHSVELLQSGEEFFSATEKVIDEATQFIHFQTYIIDEDETGLRIINALIRATGRNVRVYLLLDAMGTSYLTGNLIKSIENAGILFRFFSPSFISNGFHLSLRLHHKVILVDGKMAIIGGMNIANRYYGTSDKKAWLDFALKIKGPECAHILNILKKSWNRTFLPGKERSREVVHHPVTYNDNIRLKALQNNWYRNKIEILRSYRSAIRHSHARMIMFSGYFLPGRNERHLLSNASRRGVDIKIVLSAESDAPVFKRATNFLYGFILRNKISIYEYLPSNLHAKVATVDGKWCTIGSYNLNHLSDYGSIELNVDICDSGFTHQFEKHLLNIIDKDCRQVTFEDFQRRSTWISKLSDWFSYQMIRLLLRGMFLMNSNRKKSLSELMKTH